MDQNCPNWIKFVQMEQSWVKWIKLVQIGSNLFKLDQTDVHCQDHEDVEWNGNWNWNIESVHFDSFFH